MSVTAKHYGLTNPGTSLNRSRVVENQNLASRLPYTTHCSESLVRYVAEVCDIEQDLGTKGKSGVLQSVETRKDFLRESGHRIRFVYVPKHTSWMNQIEIWFSILVRRVIKRGNFLSAADLREKILAFIDYFNRALAKPFKWTYTGRPLNV